MSNETTSAILSFAEKHHDFNIEDLSELAPTSRRYNRGIQSVAVQFPVCQVLYLPR